MQRWMVSVVVGAMVMAFAGCSTTGATQEQLLKRAAFDFDCSESELELHELDERTVGIRGCGHRATYVEMCNTCANGYQGCDCSWMLNTDGVKDEGARGASESH